MWRKGRERRPSSTATPACCCSTPSGWRSGRGRRGCRRGRRCRTSSWPSRSATCPRRCRYRPRLYRNRPEETRVSAETVARLRDAVVEPLKGRFVERGEVIDLIALALVAGEHLFLYGPPGTAKSALIRHFAGAVHGRYFEYMLTRF